MIEARRPMLYMLVAIGILFCITAVLGACTASKQRATVTGGAAPATITQQGPTTGTWNQQPHGGADEKSNSTPSKPLE